MGSERRGHGPRRGLEGGCEAESLFPQIRLLDTPSITWSTIEHDIASYRMNLFDLNIA